MSAPDSHPVVLFDGDCAFCNRTVRFLVARDPGKVLRLAPLQSPVGQCLLREHGMPTEDHDTIVLVDGDRIFVRSTAALRTLRYLRGLWPILGVLLVIPRVLRDAAYRFVAARRFRWFGTSTSCELPSADWHERMVG